MKAPSIRPGDTTVNGNFIATMFVYKDANALHWREIDWEVTGDGPGSVMTNMLTADGTRHWRSDLAASRQQDIPGVNVRADFHTYAFEWLPDRITWYLDGRKV